MNGLANEIEIIGRGTYTVADAERLSGVPSLKIRRWLRGRHRSYQGASVFDPPLWLPEFPAIDDELYLTFRDLIELRMVDRFRHQRISMPYLRKVVAAAQELVGDHPFSTSRFKSDGRKLYLEMLTRTGEPKLIEVLSGQHAFHSIISLGLKDLEFEDGIAALWRPESGHGEVVLDPGRAFGRPILDRYGVPTSVIAQQVRSGRSAREVGIDFEVDDRAVRAAMSFEDKLAA